MDFKKLNEELQKFICNEISVETRASYLAKRQQQADKANARLDKAKQLVKNSEQRDLKNLPKETDKQNAENALNDLKYEMKRISNGDTWRLETEDDTMMLEVRYWGSWSGDDGSGDYDWQTLDQEYRDELDKLTANISKKYNVQINYDTSEKNWIYAEIKVNEEQQEDKSLLQQILDLGFEDSTGPKQKKDGIIMLKGEYTARGYRIQPESSENYTVYALNNYGVNSRGPYRTGKDSYFGTLDRCLEFILDNAQKHLKRMKVI